MEFAQEAAPLAESCPYRAPARFGPALVKTSSLPADFEGARSAGFRNSSAQATLMAWARNGLSVYPNITPCSGSLSKNGSKQLGRPRDSRLASISS